MRYEIQHWTLGDGWVNTSTDADGNPLTFETKEEAQAEIDELLAEHVEPDCTPYDADEFRVVPCEE